MASDLRKDWKKAKKKADTILDQRGTSLHELVPSLEKLGLGPALDKLQKEIDKFERLSDNADKLKAEKKLQVLMMKLTTISRKYSGKMDLYLKNEGKQKYESGAPELKAIRDLSGRLNTVKMAATNRAAECQEQIDQVKFPGVKPHQRAKGQVRMN